MFGSLSDEMKEINDYLVITEKAQFCQYLRTYLTEILVVTVINEQDFQDCRNGDQQGIGLNSAI